MNETEDVALFFMATAFVFRFKADVWDKDLCVIWLDLWVIITTHRIMYFYIMRLDY